MVLKIGAIVCSLAILFSFAAFARDAAGDGSKRTVQQIASADQGTANDTKFDTEALDRTSPGPRVEKVRQAQHTQVREVADDANDVLAGPFSTVGGNSIWAQRIVSGLLALLLFGAGLGFLSRLAALRGV
jgi:hypothetical protein